MGLVALIKKKKQIVKNSSKKLVAFFIKIFDNKILLHLIELFLKIIFYNMIIWTHPHKNY